MPLTQIHDLQERIEKDISWLLFKQSGRRTSASISTERDSSITCQINSHILAFPQNTSFAHLIGKMLDVN